MKQHIFSLCLPLLVACYNVPIVVPEPAECGNGAVEIGEQCDDRNTADGDFCESDCTLPRCGNEIVDIGEECDPPGVEQNCGSDCQLINRFCGDGLVDAGEACDDGNNNIGDGCRPDCSEERCGDSILDLGEACDDGNLSIGDGCRPDCSEERCGDNILDLDEACDDGNIAADDGCRSDCQGLEVCGDTLLDVGEVCDDGNTAPGDGCRTDCLGTELCGDGLVDVGEGCDDSNATNGDGCDSNCTVTSCGNGVLTTGEACDDGNAIDGDACESDCSLPACKNGIVDLGEFCPDSNPSVINVNGSNPGLALGDLDGDGDLDIVTTDTSLAKVKLLLNNGAGGFATPIVLETGANPLAVALGDINADGHLDIVTANFTSSTASVFLQQTPSGGGLSFSTTTMSTNGADGPHGVALGDLDQDGDLDMALTLFLTNRVVVYTNEGGSFVEAAKINVNQQPIGLTIAQIDGVGTFDIAVASQSTLNFGADILSQTTLLLNFTGAGFGSVVNNLKASNRSRAVAAGDFDGNGFVDIATMSTGASVDKVNIRKQIATGTFAAAPIELGVGDANSTLGIAVGDLNLDGTLDVGVANDNSNNISVLLNQRVNGVAGVFSVQAPISVGVGPQNIAFGDLNNDGALDIVVANTGQATLSLLISEP